AVPRAASAHAAPRAEGVDDHEVLPGGPGNQQPAVVGAQIDRRISLARPGVERLPRGEARLAAIRLAVAGSRGVGRLGSAPTFFAGMSSRGTPPLARRMKIRHRIKNFPNISRAAKAEPGPRLAKADPAGKFAREARLDEGRRPI